MEMYNNKFVMCVLVNGQIVRETDNGEIHLIPGTEYTIRLRNKNNRRAVAKVSIDGENISDGGFVINAQSFIDVERTVDKAVKFKFVELDSADAQDFGKDRNNEDGEMGVISATFYLEKAQPVVSNTHIIKKRPSPFYDQINFPNNKDYWAKPVVRGSSNISNDIRYQSMGLTAQSKVGPASELNFQTMDWCETVELGCTVEGGYSEQKFKTIHIDTENVGYSIRLFLKAISTSRLEALREAEVKYTEALALLKAAEKNLANLKVN